MNEAGRPKRRRISSARIYNESIGARSGTSADLAVLGALDEAMQLRGMPGVENRSFLVRAVDYLARQGVGQFLDIGVGLPAWGNVYQVARRHRPDAAVACVDHDLEVVAAWREIAAEHEPMRSVYADVRRPREILEHPEVRAVIDFDRPVGLLLTAVLHLVGVEHDQRKIVRTLTDALPSGSHLVLSHVSDQRQPAEAFERVRRIVESAGSAFTVTSPGQVAEMFGGLELVEPGLVMVEDWRPVRATRRSAGWYIGGVGRKP
ncbi:SAM-dependent methyltransferase [Actinomadura craniellae]|uniref:SAM-dependent methyltransferase n=1 Tax=Actinomadura craniellae TaxID=2231787 RepID=UPI0013141E45|nr:SAM-dependent methyltransferase [Actinomadura craniellae]